jgi:hypothetical protein
MKKQAQNAFDYIIEAFAKRFECSRIEKLVSNQGCPLDFSILEHSNPIAK